MWLLILIISIKLKMPTWYWILFTIWTMVMPLWTIIKYKLVSTFLKRI